MITNGKMVSGGTGRIVLILVLVALGIAVLGFHFTGYYRFHNDSLSEKLDHLMKYYEDRVDKKEQSSPQEVADKPEENSVDSQPVDREDWDKVMEFAPKNGTMCDNIFKKFAYPKPFMTKWNLFLQKSRLESKKDRKGEGSIAEVFEQQKFYYHLSQLDFVINVCEIGFNAGHSAFVWLESHDKINLYSFDLGIHNYTKSMANYIKYNYQDRFNIFYGDSTKTVPSFSSRKKWVVCDVLVVDGGHTYELAKADLINMQKLANKERNVVILDDYPTYWGTQLGKAWKETQDDNIMKELYGCSIRKGRRGFSVGHYTFGK